VNEPFFLDFDAIEKLHQASLNAYGGSPGIATAIAEKRLDKAGLAGLFWRAAV
jgi:hypothetical protein